MAINYRNGGSAARDAWFAYKDTYDGKNSGKLLAFIAGWNAREHTAVTASHIRAVCAALDLHELQELRADLADLVNARCEGGES